MKQNVTRIDRTMPSTLVLLASVLASHILSCAPEFNGEESVPIHQHFRPELPPEALQAWKEIEQRLSEQGVRIIIEWSDKHTDGNYEEFQETRVLRFGENFLNEWTLKRRRSGWVEFVSRVQSRTSVYQFELGRDSRNEPFRVRELDILDSDSDLLSLQGYVPWFATGPDRSANEPSRIMRQVCMADLGYAYIPSLLRHERVSITSVKTRKTGILGRELVAIEFTVAPGSLQGMPPYTHGIAYLDPNHGWMPTECRFWFSNGDLFHVKVHDRQVTQGIPVCYHVTMEAKRGNEVGRVLEHRITSFQLGPIPEREFHLTAYGLPEIEGYELPKSYWLYWSIAGLICFILGVLLLRFGTKLLNRP